MRRFVMTALVALAAGASPAMLRAEDSNPNQQAAQKICTQLRDSGQLGGRKVGVRYLNGTVWLQGQVADREHYNKVLEAVMATSNVTITRVIPDGLTIDGAAIANTSQPASPSAAAAANPLRGATAGQSENVNRAQPVPSSFSAGSPATLAAMMQTVPSPPAAPAPPMVASPSRLPAADTPAGHACLRLAKLRRLSELRRGDLSKAVFAHRLAVHWSVLSLSAGPFGMAESQPAMGRRLVVVGLQRQVQRLLVAVSNRGGRIDRISL